MDGMEGRAEYAVDANPAHVCLSPCADGWPALLSSAGFSSVDLSVGESVSAFFSPAWSFFDPIDGRYDVQVFFSP